MRTIYTQPPAVRKHLDGCNGADCSAFTTRAARRAHRAMIRGGMHPQDARYIVIDLLLGRAEFVPAHPHDEVVGVPV